MKHVIPNNWKNTHEKYNERFKLLYERCYDAWFAKMVDSRNSWNTKAIHWCKMLFSQHFFWLKLVKMHPRIWPWDCKLEKKLFFLLLKFKASQQIKSNVISLITITIEPKLLTSHKAFLPTPPSFTLWYG